MPTLQYWFSGPALGAFIALGAAVLSLGYGWYRAASDAEQHDLQKVADERRILLSKLTSEYIASHDGISPGLFAGTELPPRDWLNKRLSELGMNWRVD